ncbi:MAG: hypothetical protein AB7O97_06580 [Planctomycetota bacterium]
MRRAPVTILLLLGTAVLVAAVLWWQSRTPSLLPPDWGDGGSTPTNPGPAPGAPARAPHDDAPKDEGTPRGTVRVWVEVQVDAELRPAPPDVVVVTRSGLAVPAEAEIVAGEPESWPRPRAPEGPALVRVRLDGADWYRRAVRDAGTLHVEFGELQPVRGRAVDDRGEPIAGVRVWSGAALDQEVETDLDGRFEVFAPAGHGVPFVARKDGLAWKVVFAEVLQGGSPPVSFVLRPEVPLQVQAVGLQSVLAHAKVALVPVDERDTELQAFPFFFRELIAATGLDATGLDATGRQLVRGLPRGAVVGVALQGPRMLRTPAVPVKLTGERHDVEVGARPTRVEPTVRGRVVDARGAAVRDALVWAWQPGGGIRASGLGPALLPCWVAAPGVVVGRTGVDGAFELALPGDREVALGAAVADGPWVERRWRGAPRDEVRLVLPAEVEAPARLEVPPPAAGTDWEVRVDPCTDGRFVQVAPDAPFVVELPPCVGDVRVRIAEGASWSSPRWQRDVVLSGVVALPAEQTAR